MRFCAFKVSEEESKLYKENEKDEELVSREDEDDFTSDFDEDASDGDDEASVRKKRRVGETTIADILASDFLSFPPDV